MSMISTLTHWMNRLERVSRLVAGVCLLAVMCIVFTDVAARYVVNAPLTWSYDLIGMYLMPALFYLALSDTLAAHHHVSVDLLRPHMPRWLVRVFEIVGSAAMAGVFLLIVQIYGQSAWEKFHTDAMVLSSMQWPAWIPDALVVFGALTISLRLLGRAIGHLLSFASGRELVELPVSVEN